MTPDLTVLISTAGRPDMLRTALQSVQAQSARDRIAGVVVSENLGDARSRAVCEEFSDLPVRHVLRTPPLDAVAHAHVLFSTDYETPFVAVLHDDDWWRPGHLERSLTALADQPDASACYGGYWCVIGEHSSFVGQQENGAFWAAAGRPLIDCPYWRLDQTQVLLATLAGALGHYSSLVARGPALRAATRLFLLDSPMDSDRHLTAELSRHGPVLFHPLPEIFVRQHADQAIRGFDDDAHQRHLTVTTQRLIAQAKSEGIDLRAALETLLNDHPAELRPHLLAAYVSPWCLGPLIAQGLAPADLVRARPAPASWLRWRAWIPPAAGAMARRWRQRG